MKKGSKLGFLLGGTLPFIVAGILFFIFVLPGFQAKKILDNGVTETGTIFDVDKSNSMVNDEYLYYIEFLYIDGTGTERVGRSVQNYKLEKIRDMGFIEISYSRNEYTVFEGLEVEIVRLNNDAVLKIEKPFNTPMNLLFAGFALVGLTLVTIGVLMVLGIVGDDKVFKHGKRGQGVYIDRAEGMTVNNRQLYKVVFSFEDDDRQLVEVKYGNYRDSEIRAFEFMRKFPIKVLGQKAVIDVDKSTLLRVQEQVAEHDARIEHEMEQRDRAERDGLNIDPFN